MIGESDLKVVIGLFQEVMSIKEVEDLEEVVEVVVEVEVEVELVEVVEGGIAKSGR